ncbi:SLAM family member 9-like isoform X5 [Rhinolophus sinicus]
MGASCEDPHLRWASWLLGLAGFLLGVCCIGPVSPRRADSRAHISLERVQGGSVWFNVTEELEGDPEAQLEEIEWRFGSDITYRRILRVGSGGDPLTWVSLQDKYKHRVRVPSMRSLLIQNLTREDSGQYRAQASFTGGKGITQVFQLSVYEPVPLPQIQAKSLSISADWCNVTLECRAQGALDDLNVTWRHSDIPRKWQQRGTLGPGPSTWPLAESLPLEQPNTSLTCAVSNQVDLKMATTTLGDVCAHHSQGEHIGRHMAGVAGAVMAVLLTMGAGLYFWKIHGKKKETEAGTGAGLEDGRRVREDDICYAELSQQESQEGGDKGVCEQPLEEKIPVTTIYSEVHRPGQAAKVI